MTDSSSTTAISSDEFTEQVIDEYLSLYDEIEAGDRAEHDLMPRLVDHVFLSVLGFNRSDYEQEDEWNDVRFFDGTGSLSSLWRGSVGMST